MASIGSHLKAVKASASSASLSLQLSLCASIPCLSLARSLPLLLCAICDFEHIMEPFSVQIVKACKPQAYPVAFFMINGTDFMLPSDAVLGCHLTFFFSSVKSFNVNALMCAACQILG